MSRLMQFSFMSWVILCSSVPILADEAEDKAVEFVEKLGGQVLHNETVPGRLVVVVSMFRTKVIDAGLKELAKLKNLKTLDFSGSARSSGSN